MMITKINKIIKCDTVMCNKNATYELQADSYKGSIFLCENCFKAMKNLFKKVEKKDA